MKEFRERNGTPAADFAATKILVYGAGAMGTVLGALLTASGAFARVDLVSRNEEHIAAMKRNGARVVCTADGREFTASVSALLPTELTEKYDLVFLMTKQKDNPQTAAFLKDYLATDGVVCVTQNGLPEESVAGVLGAERVFGAACAWGATFAEAGCVHMTSVSSAMSMLIGGFAGEKTDKIKSAFVAAALERAGEQAGAAEFVRQTDNLAGARWSKLAINAAFSGLSVLTGKTFGEIAKGRKSRKIALGILRECFSVASAAGVRLEKVQGHDLEKLLGSRGFFGTRKALFLLPFAMKKHAGLVSGMLKDIQKGRKCEIDYVDGAVCRTGAKFGVKTPLCDRVVEIAHGIENGLYEIGGENLDFFP